MKNKGSLRARLGSFLMVLLGNVLYALTVRFFVIPSELVSCGTTGIAMVMEHLLGIPMSSFILVFNLVMLWDGGPWAGSLP